MARKFKITGGYPVTYPDIPEVSITSDLQKAVMQANPADWKALFQNFRLLFRSRLLSCQGDDLIKLQGKLQAVDEIEVTFIDMLKPAS
jgi:hypothetical protein